MALLSSLAACRDREPDRRRVPATRPRSTTTAPAPMNADPGHPPDAAEPNIRVRLATEIDAFEIAVDGPCELRDARGTVLSSIPERLPPRTLTRDILRPPGFDDLQKAGVAPPAGLDVVPSRDGSLRIRLPGAGAFTAYRGRLRCNLTRSGRIEVVNELPVEEYLRSVVASEMPGSFQSEAIQAQAIAARTYALWLRNTVGEGRTWDVKTGEGSQVYAGIRPERQTLATDAAVEATRGVVCTWNTPAGPRIFCTYYSAVCGGWTQPASAIANDEEIPPLCGGVECGFCSIARSYRWGPERIPRAVVAANLRERYARFGDLGPVEVVEPLEPVAGGRPSRIRVADANGHGGTLRAEDFRLAVDPTGRVLRSTYCRITIEGNDVVFSDGRGYGHGVGLCQWGAEGLARAGRTAGEILAFYYPGSRLSLAYR